MKLLLQSVIKHFTLIMKKAIVIFIIHMGTIATKRIERAKTIEVENFQESVYLSTLGTMTYVLSILVPTNSKSLALEHSVKNRLGIQMWIISAIITTYYYLLLLQETGAMQETGANPRLFLPHKTTILLVVSTCICLRYFFLYS